MTCIWNKFHQIKRIQVNRMRFGLTTRLVHPGASAKGQISTWTDALPETYSISLNL